jgi:hydrogenase-4 component F
VAAAFLLVLVAFVAIARHTAGMLLGPPTGDARASIPPARDELRWMPLVLGLAAAAVLGVWLGPLQPLLDSAALIAAEGAR